MSWFEFPPCHIFSQFHWHLRFHWAKFHFVFFLLLTIKRFRTRIFLKHWKVPPRNILSLREKKCRRKIVIQIPFSLIHIFFSIGKDLWNTERIPYVVLRSCETKNFRQSHEAPLSYAWRLSVSEVIEAQKRSSTNFSALWDNEFSREKSDIHFLWENVSIPGFSETLNGSTTKYFGALRQKILDRKSWCPLLIEKNFSIPESFWCIELFPNKIFWFCETNKFEPKVVIPPLSGKIKKSLLDMMFLENLQKIEFKQ